MAKVFTELETIEELQAILAKNTGVVILKFGADFCIPCKKIKPHINACINKLPATYQIYDLDIDENLDIYAFFKNKRMVHGIPAMLAWKKGNKTSIPSETVASSDPKQIDAFFAKCATP